MMVAMMFSSLFALVIFPTTLAVCGPTGSSGKLPADLFWAVMWWRRGGISNKVDSTTI